MDGQAIAYTIVESSLGKLLLAGSERGVCQVRFGESEAELEEGLAAEFPFPPLRRDEVTLKPWCDALVAYVDGHCERLALPLDVRGSRFQRRVWEALRQIPRGRTLSYAELAAELGKPGAARAVAQACARNPVAVAIPCHRIVASDGGLGGYHWGTARKRALLEREGALAEDAR